MRARSVRATSLHRLAARHRSEHAHRSPVMFPVLLICLSLAYWSDAWTDQLGQVETAYASQVVVASVSLCRATHAPGASPREGRLCVDRKKRAGSQVPARRPLAPFRTDLPPAGPGHKLRTLFEPRSLG
jgi:hypothetical protein